MTITLISNFMNHHQEQLSKKLYEITDGNFRFIACKQIEQERLDMGYEDMNKKYDFIIRPYESQEHVELAKALVISSDIVIFGSGDERYFKIRMKTGKLTFRYSERFFKKGIYKVLNPITRYKIHNRYVKYKNDNLYTLCSSAYTSYDLKLCGFTTEKCFKWGYFPKVIEHSIDELINNKKKNSIIWVGRLIDWKHPEIPLKIAKMLRKDNIDFEINIIGTGVMEEKLNKYIKKNNLQDKVKLLGAMPPEDVREYMEKSEIFLTTSDFNEGWGAVLNEAMNSGCACVASHAVGAAPYLVKDGENGFLYKNGCLEELYNKVLDLLYNSDKRKNFGIKAYETICNEWDAENAAVRIIRLSEVLSKNREAEVFKEGICSRAKVLKNNWY